MKKIISITLASALCLGLCACQSDNKYDDLERRVSAIEDQLNIDQSEVVQTSNNNTESSEISESIESNHVYDLSGMSAEEMLNLFISFADIHTGDMITDYPSRFDVEPYSTGNGNISYNFYEVNYNDITNCILTVFVDTQIEMDNSITIEDNSRIQINLKLEDYNLAAELYDLAYNYAVNNGNIYEWADNTDNREGTHWSSYVNYYVFTMDKNDNTNDYMITLTIPIELDNQSEETMTVQEASETIMP